MVSLSGISSNAPCAASPSDVVFVTSSYDRLIKFWKPDSLQNGVAYREIQHADSQVNCMAISPDKRFLACGGYQHVQLYDFQGSGSVGGPMGTGGVPAAGGRVMKFNGFHKNIMALGFQEDGSWMFTAGEDGIVRVWEIREDSSTPLLKHDLKCGGPINCAVLHPNQAELFLGDHQGYIYLLDLRGVTVCAKFKPEGELVDDAFIAIQSLALDVDATMLAALTNKGTCHVWSVSTMLTHAPTPKHHTADSASSDKGDACSSTSSTSTSLNLDSDHSACALAPTKKFFPRKSFQAHEKYGLKCQFSYDSTILATCSADKSAKIWNTTDFSILFTLSEDFPSAPPSFHNWFWDCAFTRDSSHLLTVSSDGMIRYWDVCKGTLVHKWQNGMKPVTCLAFFEPPS